MRSSSQCLICLKTLDLLTLFDPDQLPLTFKTCMVMTMLLQMILNTMSTVATPVYLVKCGVIEVKPERVV